MGEPLGPVEQPMLEVVLLLIDGVLNLGLGVLLAVFPARLVQALGLPPAELPFYARILGGVLFGIGVALLLETFPLGGGVVGLGLAGAVVINLCGAAMVTVWLVSKVLDIPIRGRALLWALVAILVGLSLVELGTVWSTPAFDHLRDLIRLGGVGVHGGYGYWTAPQLHLEIRGRDGEVMAWGWGVLPTSYKVERGSLRPER
ncbi:MAG: hypothetical protein ACE5FK_00455 [Candidatus Methylomirabilia bacterium]